MIKRSKEYTKITLWDDELFTAEMEVNGGIPYMHCVVHQWSPQKWKTIKATIYGILRALKEKKGIDYFFVNSPTPKVTKWAKMLGCKEVATFTQSRSLLFMRY